MSVEIGTNGDDTLSGGTGSDILVGRKGDDELNGGSGSDLLLGGKGDDQLDGGGGDDLVKGGSGNDDLSGGNGDDVLLGGSGNDQLDGGAGDDLVKGGSGNDDLSGGNGDDVLLGGSGNDQLDGGAGDDLVKGGSGNDDLSGGNGDDLLLGGAGADLLSGGAGDDRVEGQSGNDTAVYVLADNVNSSDYYSGGSGHDVLRLVLSAAEFMNADVQADIEAYQSHLDSGGRGAFQFSSFDLRVTGFETVEVEVQGEPLDYQGGSEGGTYTGGEEADTAIGGVGEDIIDGGGGDDLIYGGGGTDTLSGGDGDDFVEGGDGDDTLDGGDGNDTLIGDSGVGNDYLIGGAGDDLLRGEAGNDLLVGGADNDIVDGGSGNDEAIYNLADNVGATDEYTGGSGVDTLTLQFTSTEWADAALRADVVSYLDFIEANTDPLTGEANSNAYQFTEFGLSAAEFEQVRVLVDGVEIDPSPATDAVDDSVSVDEDDGAVLFGSVLDNDTASAGIQSVALVSDVAKGMLTFNPGTVGAPDGSFSFDPNGEFDALAAGESETVSFAYQLTDGQGGTDTATVSITITGSNDAPMAFGDALSGVASADGTEIRVNTETTFGQVTPDVSALPDGGYVAVWVSDNQDGDQEGVFAQTFDASGAPSGGEFQVNLTYADRQQAPAVATLDNGDFVVVWESIGQDNYGYGIFGRQFAADGTPLGGEFEVSSRSNADQNDPQIAALGDGGFIVTWWSQDNGSADGGDVFARRYDASGISVGGEFQVNAPQADEQREATVAALADGGFVIAWKSIGQDGDQGGIYAQQYDAAGAPVGSEFLVNTAVTAGNQEQPAIAGLPGGGYVIAWTSAAIHGTSTGIVTQQFDATGAPVGDAFVANTTTVGESSSPSVDALADGGFVVAWHSRGVDSDSGSLAVVAQRFDAAGNRVDGEFQVNTYETDNQVQPAVAGLPDGDFVVTWTSNGQDGSSFGVYSQVFSVAAATNEDVVLSVDEADLRANDTDVDGDTISINSVSAASALGASIVRNSDGSIDYDPSAAAALQALGLGEKAVDTFTYTVSDGGGGSDTALVSVVVDGVNDRPEIASAPVEEAFAEQVTPAGQFTAGGTITFSDVDVGDTHTVSAINGAVALYDDHDIDISGSLAPQDVADLLTSLEINPDGTWTFEADANRFEILSQGYRVELTADVTVTNSSGAANAASAPQTLTVTITGTNDAPVVTSGVQAGSVTELADGDPQENAFTHEATGSIAFDDIDLTDTHTVTVTDGDSGYLGAFATALSDSGGTGSGSLGWTFQVDDAALDGLAAGEVLTQTYDVAIDDGHGGTASETVTVTITGSADNSAPVITGGTQAGSATEIADGASGENADTHTASGALTFTDADTLDTHTASFAPQAGGYRGSFALAPVDQSGDTLGWTFQVDDAALDDLQAGQVLTQLYDVTIDDGAGGTDTATVSITITGSNDAPVITSSAVDAALVEPVAPADLSAGGTIAFSDADAGDTHVVSATTPTVVYSAGTLDPADVAGLQGALVVDPDGTWGFTVPAAAGIDRLAAGETITLTSTLTVTDSSGAANAASAPQTLTVTITGTNDAPVVTSGVQAGSVTELADGDPQENAFTHEATGSIAFDDIDLTDTHTVTVTDGDSGYLGAFATALSDSGGTGSGSLGWTFQVDDAALDGLAAGEVLTQTYDVAIDDGHGGTTSETVTVTITGAADNGAPVITQYVGGDFGQDIFGAAFFAPVGAYNVQTMGTPTATGFTLQNQADGNLTVEFSGIGLSYGSGSAGPSTPIAGTIKSATFLYGSTVLASVGNMSEDVAGFLAAVEHYPSDPNDLGAIMGGYDFVYDASAATGAVTVALFGGDDTATGTGGDNSIGGAGGDDQLHGDDGEDTLYGDDSDDTFSATGGPIFSTAGTATTTSTVVTATTLSMAAPAKTCLSAARATTPSTVAISRSVRTGSSTMTIPPASR